MFSYKYIFKSKKVQFVSFFSYFISMKKQEFIEKYGEEAYKKRLQQTRDWHAEHKGHHRKDNFIASYGEEAWEKVLERARKWKTDNKEKHLANVKEWQKSNKDKTNTYKKKWKEEHPKETRIYNLLAAYKATDADEGRGECTLTHSWIMDHIFASSCIYCGDTNWEHLGADRIDNTLPHTPENCVCACGICNVERSDRYTVAEFIEYRKTHPRECDKVKSGTL